MKKIEVLGLERIPEIKAADNLAKIIVEAAEKEAGGLREKDIVVLTSKIVSKAMGLTRRFGEVVPGKKALKISKKTGKDARWLQMIFDEGHEILAILPLKGIAAKHIIGSSGGDDQCTQELIEHEQAICITRSKEGRVHTCDAGIDGSNHPGDVVSFLPKDPDGAAREIREEIRKFIGREVAVILADTEMVPFGTMDLAIGSAGISPRSKMFGRKDLFGKPKFGGMDIVAHELTAASALVFGQVNAGVPAAIIRGYEYETSETESVSNTILNKDSAKELSAIIRATLKATAYAKGFKQRILLRIASWLV